jgi:hypothetical protein
MTQISQRKPGVAIANYLPELNIFHCQNTRRCGIDCRPEYDFFRSRFCPPCLARPTLNR